MRYSVVAALLLVLNGCGSTSAVWVHRTLVWPGLTYDESGEPVIVDEVTDPLDETHADLALAGVQIHNECGVELPVCAALGCPGRSIELYIEISESHVVEAQDLGFQEAEANRPPNEKDGSNPCEPL